VRLYSDGVRSDISADEVVRVMSIAHTANMRGSGRLRYRPIAAGQTFSPNSEPVTSLRKYQLTLIVPKVWHEYGRDQSAHPPSDGINIRLEPIWFRNVPKAKWYLHFYPRFGHLIGQLSPDVIHLWEEPWSVVALQALILRDCYAPKAAVVLETDQNILRRLPFPFEQIRRFALRNIDALIVRTDEAEAVSRACGYTGPVATVEYCVDKEVFYPADREGARHELGSDGLILGYVGRLVPEKGLSTVLKAMSAAPSSVVLFIIGEGPEQPSLEQEVQALGLGDRVSFLGRKSMPQVARFLNGIDVLALMSRTAPTWKEQFGRVIIEAQACGVPIIGSDSGAIPGVVGGGGWVVPEGDSASLTSLLNRLAQYPEEVRAASEAALAQAWRFEPGKTAADLCRSFDVALRARQQKLSVRSGQVQVSVGS
jgi:glycosyltransferase involved in cell wall biosynthesis